MLRAGPRRASQAAAAVLFAGLAAGIRQTTLPLVGGPAPRGLGVAGARDPFDVLGTLGRALGAHPGLLGLAAGFALIAVALPHAQPRGRWGAVAVASGLLLVALPTAQAVSLTIAAWLTAGVMVYRAEHV